ncbi:Rib/alpha-like domain-containing protein [Dolosigranulum pigrum]|uniref:Rib/alpha-like domain-containing protein n=1 Tax=Dolosigranulum pigrum TaxID=29394 RepID=UPI001AD8813D|nr:Rib/alpha-like domain-containing protein [Dolosigranulum pigrum]QTJ55192.1 YSIRK-type signal peptide-containing protein [Dolosigranulum pigrum]
MVGKNNKQARWSKSANTFKRYSLKKLSVGVASVVIGTGVAWASSTTVHAAEEGTEVVTGDGEKEAPVESAVPTEAPVVGGDESSSQDAVADLVSQIKAAEEPASEAVDTVEPREANESSDNDYEPIPSDAIEGAAETSDEEKDAGGEDKINEERHTEEVSKEDKDNAEEKLDNEEFQGSFLRSARGRGRGRGRGGSTGTGENSGSATATRDAGSEEPAVEILSASKLPQNPPVFYANEQRGNAVDRDTGLNTVRTTGILAGTFFPEGTKFRLKDNRFTFDKGADAQKEGGNEGQWNRTATIGWFGPSRSGVVGQETNPEKLLTPGIGKKATPFTPHPNNHPYVVRDTGQVLFGLGPSAVKGERINVPMVAEWKDPKTGRTHQWEFFQGIQVGDPKVANRNQKPDNEKDWVFVGETPAENERQSGNVKIGTRDNIVGQNFGWYGQKMGDIGQWIERKNVPKFRPTLADTAEAVEPQYQPVENGGTQSAQPNFVNQDNSSQKVEKPAGTKFAKGDNAPAGATVNPDTGVVSFDKPVDKETTVPVKVTYQDGSSDTTNVVFKPAAKKTNEEVEPSYKRQTITQGEETTTDAPTFDVVATADTTESDPAPEGTTYELGENPNLPEGVKADVDGQTGAVTITSSNKTPVGDFTVPVKVTYSDKSTDNAEVSVIVEKGTNTAEEVEPKYAKPDAGAKTSGAPTFHKQGDENTPADKPEAGEGQDPTKFEITGENPSGATIDATTGEVTLPNKPTEETTVNVQVTYPDGSTDTTNVTFTPEASPAPKTNEEIEPKYTNPDAGVQTSGAPTFHKQGDENTPADKPEAGEGQDPTKFEITGENPSGATIDATTGEVTLPNKPTEETTVNVQVTYPDGSTDTTNVTFTPEASPAPKTNEEVEPKYTNPDAGVQTSGEPTFHKQGDENTPAGKPEAGEGQDPTKFEITGENPSGATIDATTGEVTLPNKPTEETTVNVQVTYPDGSTDTTNVTFTPEASPAPKTNEEVEPKYTNPDAGVQTSGEPTFHKQGDENTPAGKPEAGEGQDPTKFEITGENPSGATIDATTGEVTLPNKPTEETTVNVQVTYPDGSTDTTNVTFTPEASPAPKTNEEIEPKYTNPDAGVQTSGAPTFHKQGDENTPADKPEAGEGQDPTKFEITGENPSGATIDATTGEVTLPNKPTEETTVNVQVTYPDGSTDTTNVTFTPEASPAPKTNEEVEPKYTNPDAGVQTSGEPTFHKQGDENTPAGKPEAGEGQDPTKFEITGENPSGATIDATTGEVTLPNKPTEETTVNVQVTYPDGSTDTTNVTFTPEASPAPKTNEEVEPKYTNPDAGVQTSGEPTFHKQGDENTPAGKPEAGEGQDPTKFEITGENPSGATIDATTGEVTLPNKPTEETTVNVQVTYPDGSTDTTNVTFTPEASPAPKTNEEIEPKYTNPDAGVQTSGAPTFHKQGDENTPADKPEAGEGQDPTKFEITGENPSGATIDATTGEVTLPNKPTEETTVNVQVTYPDGSTDTTNVTFTPEASPAPKTNEEVEPKYTNPDAGVQTSGEPTFHKQGDENTPAGKPEAGEGQDPTKFEITGENPSGATIDATTGEVTLPNKPIEETTVNVQVTYPDGSTDTTSVTFTPEVSTAPTISGYEDKTITEGRLIEPITPEITNKGEGDITANGLPDGLNINPETGEITGTPDVTDWNDNFNSENPSASEFEDERDFKVTVTVPGQPESIAEFTITVQRDTDGDGTADVNDPDSDGDGINDNVELERGTNPKDANDFKGPELSVNTPKKGEETVSGKTEPQTSVTVKDTDGTVIGQGVSDEEGNFEVPVNRPLKGGEELDVTAGAPDNDKDQTTERVTVDTPDNEEYEPKWEDTNAEDGKRVVVPNTGDEIPAGSTTTATITEDPNNKGKANWTVTVDDNGDVEVTPGSDAQPGDSATVTVETTYPDGTKDSSSFKVTVPTIQSFEYDPQGQDIEVPEDGKPNAADGIANKDELPEGTEFEFDGPVDTSRPGKTNAKVIVAYPDGSTDTVDVTVNVTEVPTQADKYEPKGNPIFVEKNGTPNAADGIANKDELPEGTEFEFDGPVDTSTPGEKKAKVIVAYPDGSTDAVDVTVNVTDGDTPQSEIFEPQGQDIKVPEGGQPNAADGIANKDELPEGTEFEFDGPVDTSTPGKKKAKVIVAYPDGSTDTVDVTVNVTPKPTAETLEPKWNDSDAKDGGPVTVPNTGDKIPAGSTTTATITEDPNNKGKGNWTVTVGEDGSVTVTPGADAQPGDSATVTVETTYPDGSKDSSSFKVTVPAVGPTHAHGDSLVHDKPSYDLDKLGHGQTQPSRPAEDKGQGQVQDKAQTPDVDKAGLPNYVPSQSGERLPDTATGAWVLGVVGLMSTGLGSALGLKRKKEDEE